MLISTLLSKINALVRLVLLLNILTATCAAKHFADFSHEQSNIKLAVHQLSNAEMIKLFNCYNPIKIVRLTSYYYALEITIENRTEKEYVLAQSNIGLNLENNLVIKSKVKTNPLIIPLLATLGASTLLISGIGFAVVPSLIASTVIGVTTLNLNMQQSNKVSLKNIRNKMLDAQHPAFIASFSITRKIIFVASKNLRRKFFITLESLDGSQKITFDIMLKK
jgi:hypothetical protein